jgi:ribose transport system substrate-binding protein
MHGVEENQVTRIRSGRTSFLVVAGIVMLSVAMLSVALLGCGSAASPSAAAPSAAGQIASAAPSAAGQIASAAPSAAGQIEVAYINPGLDEPYWNWVLYGVKDAAAQHNVTVVPIDTHHDPAQQASGTQTAITMGVKGIVLSPNSSTNAPNVLGPAAAAKIPVSIAAIGTDSGDYVSFTTSADLQQGRDVGAYMKKILNGKGDIILLALDLTRANAKLKLQGITESLAGSNIKIVQTQQAKLYTIEEASGFARDMLTANPTATGIISMYDAATLGAISALQILNKVPGKDIQIIGMDGNPQTFAMVKSGQVAAISAQEAAEQGRSAMEQLWNALNGLPVLKEVLLPEPLITPANYAAMLPTIEGKVYPPGTK